MSLSPISGTGTRAAPTSAQSPRAPDSTPPALPSQTPLPTTHSVGLYDDASASRRPTPPFPRRANAAHQPRPGLTGAFSSLRVRITSPAVKHNIATPMAWSPPDAHNIVKQIAPTPLSTTTATATTTPAPIAPRLSPAPASPLRTPLPEPLASPIGTAVSTLEDGSPKDAAAALVENRRLREAVALKMKVLLDHTLRRTVALSIDIAILPMPPTPQHTHTPLASCGNRRGASASSPGHSPAPLPRPPTL